MGGFSKSKGVKCAVFMIRTLKDVTGHSTHGKFWNLRKVIPYVPHIVWDSYITVCFLSQFFSLIFVASGLKHNSFVLICHVCLRIKTLTGHLTSFCIMHMQHQVSDTISAFLQFLVIQSNTLFRKCIKRLF